MSAQKVSDRLSAHAVDRLRSGVTTVGDRETLTVRSPYTDEPVGTMPACEPPDVAAAVERAREAQTAWAARPVEERAAVL